MLHVAAFENKVEMMSEKILRVTRRTRVLEERVMPRLHDEISAIVEYMGERERETHFRLKKFKSARGCPPASVPLRGHAAKVVETAECCLCKSGESGALTRAGPSRYREYRQRSRQDRLAWLRLCRTTARGPLILVSVDRHQCAGKPHI